VKNYRLKWSVDPEKSQELRRPMRSRIRHLHIKPQNILARGDKPIVGDLGMCFIDDNELNQTREGPHDSM